MKYRLFFSWLGCCDTAFSDLVEKKSMCCTNTFVALFESSSLSDFEGVLLWHFYMLTMQL